MKRYEIHWADLEPTTGAEVSKSRPVVIVSLDVLNEALGTITVCPLTSTIHREWRTHITVKAGDRDADIMVEQIRTISKARIGKKIGTLSAHDAALLKRVITELYGE